MARRGLKHVEYAVEIGGEHGPPLFFGAVDEGVAAAAADPGIGKAAVDPAEPLQRRRHRRFHRGGQADIADASIDLAGRAGHGRGGAFVLLGVAAPDRDIAAGRGQGLRDAEPDAAVAAGDDRDATGEVKYAHERCRLVVARVNRASDGGQVFLVRTMDKLPEKIKYGFETKALLRAAE